MSDTSDTSDTSDIHILASDFSTEFDGFSATTDHKQVSDCVQFFKQKSKKDLEVILGQIGKNLTKYNKNELLNINEQYKKNSEEWNNWISDLILFYCCRFVLYNKPIPIFKNVS